MSAHDVMHVDPLTQQERTHCEANSKRLEEGTFAVPQAAGDGQSVELSADELGLILSGIDLAGATRRKRYGRKTA